MKENSVAGRWHIVLLVWLLASIGFAWLTISALLPGDDFAAVRLVAYITAFVSAGIQLVLAALFVVGSWCALRWFGSRLSIRELASAGAKAGWILVVFVLTGILVVAFDPPTPLLAEELLTLESFSPANMASLGTLMAWRPVVIGVCAAVYGWLISRSAGLFRAGMAAALGAAFVFFLANGSTWLLTRLQG